MGVVGSSGDLDRVVALHEPNRRRIYEQLSREDRPVSRRRLSDLLGIGENLLTFHLDRLADAGVVRVVAANREPGRPGRPARLYELVSQELAVSVPPRRYDLVAEVLARAALEQAPDETYQQAAERAAAAYGAALARTDLAARRYTAGGGEQLTHLLGALGYSPCGRGADVVLDNCPFDRLREVNTPLVCGLNHALLQGYLDGLGVTDRVARLEPDVARCCVVVAPVHA